MAIATEVNEYYFDFQTELSYSDLNAFKDIFNNPKTLWVNHHIKFDLHFIRREGIEILGDVWCTLVMARVSRNDHMSYSLDSCGERIGVLKNTAVKEYLDSHGCFDYVTIPGKKTRIKNYHFEQVPREILMPYALQDARVAYSLYQDQMNQFNLWNREGIKPITQVIELEKKTTKVILDMESHGILIDQDYCNRAAYFETARINQAREAFTLQTGRPFIDSAKTLTPLFKQIGFDAGTTAKGRDSFDEGVLARIDHPLAKTLLDYRNANKRLGTYFSSFIYYSRSDGRIHCNLNQGGTATGRFSSSSPNLQNLSDEDEADTAFPIRKAFTASPGCTLLSIDYQAMEYRLMLDYAGQLDVIEEVKNGKDLHQACADLMGVNRKEAKTISFSLLYGAGIAKLAASLGVPESRAKELKNKYFSTLPKVQELIRGIINIAKRRQYVFNILGRPLHFPDSNWAYKAPNYVIQSGCADIMRIALCGIHEILKTKKSKLLLQIHDEVIIELHEDELDLIPFIKDCMIKAYKPKVLPMDVSVNLGPNLHDLTPWKELVNGTPTGSKVQREGDGRS